MTTKHTQGPWFADEEGRIWRRPLSELYERGGTVAGDKPIAVAYFGWYRTDEKGYPVEDNARLIAAAPELLEVAQDFQEALQELGLFCECGEADCRTTRLRAAIAKATGQPHD